MFKQVMKYCHTNFCNCYHIGIKFVKHMIYELKVIKRLCVGIKAEIFVIIATESVSNSMGVVQHGGYSIKAEAIEPILFQIPYNI